MKTLYIISHSPFQRTDYRLALELADKEPTTPGTFIFVNLIDFDMLYGHRRDVQGYGDSLEEFDKELKKYMNEHLRDDDLLMLTADHGCDPSFRGTDHTRERVPLLMYGPGLKSNAILEERNCFTDIAATVLDNFGISHSLPGESFLKELI